MSETVSVITLSSDEEEPAPKRNKCDLKPPSNVVVIDDDDDDDDDIICLSTPTSEPATAAPLISNISDESEHPKRIKRLELTTLSPKIENETKTKLNTSNGENVANLLINDVDEREEIIKKPINDSTQENVPSSPISAKEEREIISELNDFIETCTQCDCGKKYKDVVTKKIPTLIAKYMYVDLEYATSKKFKDMLKYSIERIKRKPSNLIIHFNDVFQELGGNKTVNLELTDKQLRHLDMLNRAMSKVHKRIKRLDEREADLDNENNSAYIMVARYKERLCTIYKKICGITGDNYHSCRSLYKSLNMNSSTYQEINKAVDRLYSKTNAFPSYYDMDKCIRQCVEKNHLQINEGELESEIKKMFRETGDIIQRRRKYELFEEMSYFTENEPDPDDQELEDLMIERLHEREKQISKVIDEFTYKQTTEINLEVSPDSDDSNLPSEEESDKS